MKQSKKERFTKTLAMFLLCAFMVLSAGGQVFAADFTTAKDLALDGKWSTKTYLERGDSEYYKFSINYAGTINIKVLGSIGGYGYAGGIELYDSNYNVITTSHLEIGSESSPALSTLQESVSQGTYYVRVYAGSLADIFKGNFQIAATFDSWNVSAALNDSFANPTPLTVDNFGYGAMTCNNQEDWYVISIPATGKYKEIYEVSYMYVYVYDGNMNEYGSCYADETLDLEQGTYYIKVVNSAGCSPRTKYSLKLARYYPAVGTVVTDNKTGNYKVTKAGLQGGTVKFTGKIKSTAASVSIPPSITVDGITYHVTAIADSAFKDDKTITKVTIPKNVTTIGKNAFSGCTKLKTVIIGSDVTSIGASAFKNCKALTKITLPSKTTKIGANAFNGCTKLKTITIKSKKMTSKTISKNAFKGISTKTTIKVPSGKAKTYKTLFQKKGLNKKVKVK